MVPAVLPERDIRVLRSALPGRDWARELGAAAQVVKAGVRDGVWRIEAGIVKCSALDDARRRVQHATRTGRAWRFWRGAAWLRERGFLAPRPLAILRGWSDAGAVEAVVASYVPGTPLIRVLASGAFEGRRLPARAQHALARELGAQARRLSSLGRFNQDHKPSNLIVTRADEWGAEVAIVDCIAVRRGMGPRSLARMLACLVIEPTGLGCRTRRSLEARCLAEACPDREERRRLAREVARLVRAQKNPVPKDNPLVQQVGS